MKFRHLVGVALLGLAVFASQEAQSQQTTRPQFYNAQGQPVYVSSTNPWPITGSISASFSGFAPNGSYGTLTATAASSASTPLPTGTDVALQNTSTVDVSCVLASGAATATTNKIIVRGGATVFVTVGANVNVACINMTGSASNVIAMMGGAGFGANFGGGGAGGGGGGAVTVADGADVAEGATTDAAASAGGTGTLSAKMRLMTTQLGTINTTLGSPFQAGGSIGNTTFASTQGTSPWIVAGGGTAGSAATGVVTVQGIASMTPLFITSATVPISTMNSTNSNSGINAAASCNFDDTTPTTLTENNFGFVRCSTRREAYTQIRDAAGNERGANVDASNRLTTAPTMVSGSVASGAVASGAVASGAVASGAFASGSIASGAMVDIGAQADSVCATATGTCSLIALQKYNNSVSPVLGAGTAYIGKTRATDGTNDGVLDPCQVVAKTNFTGSQTTGTQIIAGTSAKKTYICSIQLIVQAAEVVNIIAGTGSVCATGSSAVMGSTTAANGMSYAANGGFTQGNGAATVIAATAANADNVCITQSGSSRITYQGTYVQL